jgi:CHASE2 domain/CHAT domain
MKNIFNLKVQKVEQTCLFDLSWGQGQKLTAQVNYSAALTHLYKEWQQAYLYFYQSDQMRGQAVGSGVARLTVSDWHAELVKAETRLMYEFHKWLRSAELYEVRAEIAKASQALVKAHPGTTEAVHLFLTCAPIELDRFPWEAWELGNEFATTGAIQIIRAPLNIKAQAGAIQEKLSRGKPRILAILGDETGLDFKAERDALKDLMRIAEVVFVGWQPEQTSMQIIQRISDAIADERGWDVLFFAGHSNETDLTGGELGIAPGTSISINEIAPQLSAARKQGLQLAIFNSCNGLNIANSLIDLGFSQVVVMREPIHNRVAQEFLVQFLQSLAKHVDVYEALMEARKYLRMEKSHTYPSSYLVPSLFCHPDAKLFKIPPFRWKQRLRAMLPNPVEAVALASTVILSTIVPFQDFMLDGRVYSQAVYRNLTQQIPADEAPPVALVEIDTESIYRAGMPNSQLHPFNRSYVAKLVERLKNLNASVVGLDLLFDVPQTDPPTGDKDLGTAVRNAVDANMWLVFAAGKKPDREVGANENIGINKWDWTLQGYVDSYPNLVELPDANGNCRQACPIAYLMSLVQIAKQEIQGLPQPQTTRTTNLRAQFLDTVEKKHSQKGDLADLVKVRPTLGLQPIIDFSLPPAQVYTKIPAWKLIEKPDNNKFPLISKQVVLIAGGNDERLMFAPGQPDHSQAPSATNYWTQQDALTGGESLAYMTHHFLTRHLVVPIPDIWLIGVAILLGKIAVIVVKRQSGLSKISRQKIIAASAGAVMFYGILGLQLYISLAVLIPWFLPSSVFLAYVLPATRRRNHV